jgi:hypothetical protein
MRFAAHAEVKQFDERQADAIIGIINLAFWKTSLHHDRNPASVAAV